MQMAPIKSAAPMPKQTMPRATLSATFIDCPPTGNIPPVRAHVAEGQRLPIFLAHLGDSNPCFRRVRAKKASIVVHCGLSQVNKHR